VENDLIIESIRIAVKPAKREELRRALMAWVGPTEVEAGCMGCRILLETSGPHSFCYEARWSTEENLTHHLTSDRYKRLLVLMDLGDDPPHIEFHTVTRTSGLDLIQRVRTAS
jgi:quinol monooxygenase YgiN